METLDLLGCYAVLNGSCLTAFRNNVSVPRSSVKQHFQALFSKGEHLNTDLLGWNICCLLSCLCERG